MNTMMEILYIFIGLVTNFVILGAVLSLIKPRMRRRYYALLMTFLLPIFALLCVLILEVRAEIWTAALMTAALDVWLIMLGISVSRLHDTNSSGWLGLLLFVPVINLMLIFALMVANGTASNNRFGNNPKLKALVRHPI